VPAIAIKECDDGKHGKRCQVYSEFDWLRTIRCACWCHRKFKLKVNAAEHGWLIDGLLTLMHQMEQVPENDLTEFPEMQELLDRLMGT
jgi:hypothetical protein